MFKHNKNTWIGLMYCVDGGTIGVTNMLFIKESQSKINVVTQNEEGADEFESCKVTPAKAKASDEQTSKTVKPKKKKTGN